MDMVSSPRVKVCRNRTSGRLGMDLQSSKRIAETSNGKPNISQSLQQIVLQLRATFRVSLSKPAGWGMNHAGYNPEGGVGMLPETYAGGMGVK